MKKEIDFNSKNLFYAEKRNMVKVGDKGYFGDSLDDIRNRIAKKGPIQCVRNIKDFNGINDAVFENNVNVFRFFYRTEKVELVDIETVDDLLRLFNSVPSYQRNILKVKDNEIFFPILGFNKVFNTVAVIDPTCTADPCNQNSHYELIHIQWIKVSNLKNIYTLANGKELTKFKE